MWLTKQISKCMYDFHKRATPNRILKKTIDTIQKIALLLDPAENSTECFNHYVSWLLSREHFFVSPLQCKTPHQTVIDISFRTSLVYMVYKTACYI